MRIKDVETLVGITKKNIRYYEQEKLLTPGRTAENSYRDYDEEDVRRLKQIKLLRKLGMPISEIRDVLENLVSLPVAANRHAAEIEGQINSLSKVGVVCGEIAAGGHGFDTIDVDAYLERMDQMEREGTVFVNIGSADVRKKYAGAISVCAVIVFVMAAAAAWMLYLFSSAGESAGRVLYAVLGVLFVTTAIGTIAALLSRVKELRKGETNDLSKY